MSSFEVSGVAIVEEVVTKATFKCFAERLRWESVPDSEAVATVHTGTVVFNDNGDELRVVVEVPLDGGLRESRHEVTHGYLVVEEFEIDPTDDTDDTDEDSEN